MKRFLKKQYEIVGTKTVILGVLRKVVINDVGDSGDVKPARGHVGCHEQPDLEKIPLITQVFLFVT